MQQSYLSILSTCLLACHSMSILQGNQDDRGCHTRRRASRLSRRTRLRSVPVEARKPAAYMCLPLQTPLHNAIDERTSSRRSRLGPFHRTGTAAGGYMCKGVSACRQYQSRLIPVVWRSTAKHYRATSSLGRQLCYQQLDRSDLAAYNDTYELLTASALTSVYHLL